LNTTLGLGRGFKTGVSSFIVPGEEDRSGVVKGGRGRRRDA
jgi:hypothetical protein